MSKRRTPIGRLRMRAHRSSDAITPVSAPGRWVQRDGCIVRFTLGVVPGRGRIREHRMPNERIAERFSLALLRTGSTGGAAPLDPEEWAGWQHAEDGAVSAPPAVAMAIQLADRSTG